MPMVDLLTEDPTPYQAPTLTELEAARAGVALSRQPSSSTGRRGTPRLLVVAQGQTCSFQSEAVIARLRPWPTAKAVRCVRSASPQALRWRRRRGCGAGRQAGNVGACGVVWREVRGARLAYGDERTILGGP